MHLLKYQPGLGKVEISPPPDHVGAKSGSFQPHLHHLVPQVEHSQILKNFSTTYNTERCHKSILRRLFGQMITPIQLPSLPQDGA